MKGLKIKDCNVLQPSIRYQFYILIGLWTLLVLSLMEGLLEKFTKISMPFRTLKEENEYLDWGNQTATNKVYGENNQIKVNFFQKHIFLYNLTHNMTKDCSLNYSSN